ncbi:hypothetical protein D7024_00920 [Desulfofundulus salinus]|uniref:Uncharacterized protein n=1 Tax=Desulfofundulus salinus TaxID=2419843 RepID=A0A494WXR3_9FIRM|nr:hypothetical protein D7024_00920 [Desulfofundulus salinum]
MNALVVFNVDGRGGTGPLWPRPDQLGTANPAPYGSKAGEVIFYMRQQDFYKLHRIGLIKVTEINAARRTGFLLYWGGSLHDTCQVDPTKVSSFYRLVAG